MTSQQVHATTSRRWTRRARRGPLAAVTFSAVALVASCTGTTAQQVVTEKTTTTTSTSTTAPQPDCAESLPAQAKAGQLLMVMVTSPDLAKEVISTGAVGGLGLKGAQSKDVGEQVKAAVGSAPIMAFVGSDEEGGTVQRLAKAIKALPSAKDMVNGQKDGKKLSPDEAGALMGDYATKMKELGFNMVFGPVADVGDGSGLGSRSFSDDPTIVSNYVDSIVKAIQAAGLIAVVKHWPGIGGGKDDPHNKLSSLASIDKLREVDLLPFQSAIRIGVKGVMVTHSVVPGLTGDKEPASLSSEAISGELRGNEGFKGLIITDSLGMGAIAATTPQDQAAEMAIAAGADIALISGTDSATKAHQRLSQAIAEGRLKERQVDQSVRRVLAAKGISGPCPDLVAAMTRIADDNPIPTTSQAPVNEGPTSSAGTGTTPGKSATTTQAPVSGKSATTSSAPPDERDTGINETIPD